MACLCRGSLNLCRMCPHGQAHLEALQELSRWDNNGPEQKGLVCISGEKDMT